MKKTHISEDDLALYDYIGDELGDLADDKFNFDEIELNKDNDNLVAHILSDLTEDPPESEVAPTANNINFQENNNFDTIGINNIINKEEIMPRKVGRKKEMTVDLLESMTARINKKYINPKIEMPEEKSPDTSSFKPEIVEETPVLEVLEEPIMIVKHMAIDDTPDQPKEDYQYPSDEDEPGDPNYHLEEDIPIEIIQKKPRKPIREVKKPVRKIKKYLLNDARKDINSLLSLYSKKNGRFLSIYEDKEEFTEEMDEDITYYCEIGEQTVLRKIEACLDKLEGEPPQSFINSINSAIDAEILRFEQLLDENLY
jgi:hypothetical protein